MSDLISRQAAIDHLRAIINATDDISGYNVGFIDGLEFCIDHLSTMPSAPSDWNEMSILKMSELVDKQAVLRAIRELSFVGYLNADDIHDAVEWLPVVEVRKKGHWVSDEDGNIECSECGRCGVGDNYCEHCGADMRGA